MMYPTRKAIRRKFAALKPLVLACASLLMVACASPQKIDRVHSSLYHQQASLQQLEKDFQQLQVERAEVSSELERLEANDGARQEEIQHTRHQLQELDGKQAEIQQTMRQMGGDVANNTQSISQINSREQQRQAIIRAQQERWEQITAQANTKLAEIDQPQMNTDLETEERNDVQP